MSMLTRQQLCAELAISESTVRRLERDGLPCTPVGARTKRYDLTEVSHWLRGRVTEAAAPRCSQERAGQEFLDGARKIKLRVYPGKP